VKGRNGRGRTDKRAAGEREQGKRADAARPPLVGVREELLEGEPEEEAQAQQQRDARREGAVIMAAFLRRVICRGNSRDGARTNYKDGAENASQSSRP